jgi:hypothetical protein
MLQKPKDISEMIMMDLRHHCAEDPETGAYLVRSDGRRKSGRPRKYWYRAPGMINAKVIYAESDDDAIRQIDGDAAEQCVHTDPPSALVSAGDSTNTAGG